MAPGNELMQMFSELAVCSPQEVREAILELQEALIASADTVGSDACPVKHVFAPGVYGREITMPAGMFVIGRIHRHGHLNVISKGRCRVLTEFGYDELTAPCTFASQPGAKRMVHVIEETVWTTVHLTNETDVDKIMAEVTADAYEDIELVGECYRAEGV